MKSDQFIDLSEITKPLKKKIPPQKSKSLIKAQTISFTNQENHESGSFNIKNSEIEIERDGEFIKIIKVNCTCGKSTQIVLDYDKQTTESNTKTNRNHN